MLVPLMATAETCEVPRFTEFVPGAMGQAQNERFSVELAMQPVAIFRIPAGFSKWGSQPHGSVVFGNHSGGVSGGIAYETMETVAPHRAGASPADFYRAIFHGLDKMGCDYLAGLQLAQQDYRLHASFGSAAEVFAYGKGDRHHFYVIRADQPNYVLNGLIRGIDRAAFETILSAVQIQ
ncbi:MAG: hypothetical protein DWQ11_13420 [Proteobacteria bacterium]|nr:MAG: hypothetical protein DWQ11_13420 [Pseudomonadota bacterium]